MIKKISNYVWKKKGAVSDVKKVGVDRYTTSDSVLKNETPAGVIKKEDIPNN